MARFVFVLLSVALVANAATILDIAKSLPQFSTLVSVASQAGVASLLDAPGLKTLFAPDNTAFSLLSNNTVGWLLNPHNQQHLLATLYYHIIPGAYTTSVFSFDQFLPTLDSQDNKPANVRVTKQQPPGGVRVNEAPIIQSDVVASNGVIQVIERVLVPFNIDLPVNDIIHTAANVPELSTLVTAIDAAGLAPALVQPKGPFVVFAPTNAAFAAVPSNVLSCLLNNKQALAQVLLLHVAAGFVYSEQIPSTISITTLANKAITLNNVGNTITINYGAGLKPAKVVLADTDTSNGVVHVIDTVLFDNTGPCAQP